MAQSLSDPDPHESCRSRAGWWWRLLGLEELYDSPRPSKAAEERAIALLKDHLFSALAACRTALSKAIGVGGELGWAA